MQVCVKLMQTDSGSQLQKCMYVVIYDSPRTVSGACKHVMQTLSKRTVMVMPNPQQSGLFKSCTIINCLKWMVWRDIVAVLCMQLQYTRSRVSCHCENILLMHVYLLEWAGFNFSLRFVTPHHLHLTSRSHSKELIQCIVVS